MMVHKVVSGGQTGVDRGALDAARGCGVTCGGWCPRGRRSEDGRIPACYPLTETGSADYRERTERNVLDSDGTLIVARGSLSGGTALTCSLARRAGRPCLVVDLDAPPPMAQLLRWVQDGRIRILNVAGPRESQHPGIQAQACALVSEMLRTMHAGEDNPLAEHPGES
jgi:hypothetical protein